VVLLIKWLQPLIPTSLYEKCINKFDDKEGALAVFQEIPELNRKVLTYIVRFLQVKKNVESGPARPRQARTHCCFLLFFDGVLFPF